MEQPITMQEYVAATLPTLSESAQSLAHIMEANTPRELTLAIFALTDPDHQVIDLQAQYALTHNERLVLSAYANVLLAPEMRVV